jgi:hypothetical protein
MGHSVQRQTILLIWLGGAILALALYVTGPDRFLDACLDFLDWADAAFHALLFNLGAQVANVVRAAAIAVYVVFIVLAFLASRRGLHAAWAVVVVTVVMLLLVWRPSSPYPAPVGRWFTVLVLAAVGAVAMTHRLLGPPPMQRGPWPPFRPPS